ncbi:MAG: hypothetical protein RLZZ436_2961, partial [Planctomycetota bacterium]
LMCGGSPRVAIRHLGARPWPRREHRVARALYPRAPARRLMCARPPTQRVLTSHFSLLTSHFRLLSTSYALLSRQGSLPAGCRPAAHVIPACGSCVPAQRLIAVCRTFAISVYHRAPRTVSPRLRLQMTVPRPPLKPLPHDFPDFGLIFQNFGWQEWAQMSYINCDAGFLPVTLPSSDPFASPWLSPPQLCNVPARGFFSRVTC